MIITITEKGLPWPVYNETVSWCPTMDLVVFIPRQESSTHVVCVYRLSGQKVWSTNSKRAARPFKSIWRQDGKNLAIIYEDNVYQIFNTANGKVIYTSVETVTTSLMWIVGEIETQQSEILPSNLFDVDYTKFLPRLPTVAANAVSRSLAMENSTGKTVALVIQGQKNGRLNFNLYGTFDCGSIEHFKGQNVVDLVCSPDLSLQYLLLRDQNKLWLAEHKTSFIKRIGPKYLTEISITPSAVLTLVDYAVESFKLINNEIEVIQSTYKQFLLEKFPGHTPAAPIGPYYFDIVLTGMLQPEIRYWLLEQTENGIRKILKAGIVAFDNLIKLVFENVIQAFERVLIYLSQLRGLAEWKDRGVVLGLDYQLIKQAVETTTSLFKVANSALWAVKKERDLYHAFSAWIETLQEKAIRENGGDYSGKPLNDTSEISTKSVVDFITGFTSGKQQWLEDLQTIDFEQLKTICQSAFGEIRNALLQQTTAGRQVLLSGTTDWSVKLFMQDLTCYMLMYKVHESLAVVGRLSSEDSAAASLKFSHNIMQAEFVDGENIMVLCDEGEQRRLLTTNYKDLHYSDISISNGTCFETAASQIEPVDGTAEKQRVFGRGFTAESFALNGLPNRRIGCILDKSSQRYIFFDIDGEEADDYE